MTEPESEHLSISELVATATAQTREDVAALLNELLEDESLPADVQRDIQQGLSDLAHLG